MATTRGRKSAAELAATVVVGTFGQRPEPLDDLTPEQAAIWRKTVASEPPEFFATGTTRSMLGDYCRHRASADMISAVIDSFKPEWLKAADGAKRYEALLRMREAETRGASNMATKLRLTNQSRYVPHTAHRIGRDAASQRPWEE